MHSSTEEIDIAVGGLSKRSIHSGDWLLLTDFQKQHHELSGYHSVKSKSYKPRQAMFLVVHTKKTMINDIPFFKDSYETHNTQAEAKVAYDKLLKQDDIYTASLCSIVESTDYESGDESGDWDEDDVTELLYGEPKSED